jgi:hypothetical protein
MPDCLQSVRLVARSTVQCILKNEDKIKDENGKKRAKVQLSLDSFFK